MRRWRDVVLAAVFINTSYGTLSYSFSVLVTKSAAGGDLGTRTIALGFAAALLVSGLASLVAGAIADVRGSRGLMAGGSVLGAAGLALLAASEEPWQAIAAMALVMGPAMAATFYEPVYVLMNRWFEPAARPRAYGVLTLLSGVSITIFVPATRWLVLGLGWRTAVLVLAGCLLAVGLAVPALVREPLPARAAAGRVAPLRVFEDLLEGLRHGTSSFWVFTGLFFAATVAFSGFSFHQVAQLEGRGFSEEGVATAVALTGVLSLPARLLLPALSARTSGLPMLAACLAILGVAAWLPTVADHWWQVWLYVGIFGVVFGSVYPLRALAVAERFAGPYFGRLIGAQALFVAVARALGPALIALAGTDRGAYEASFRACGVVLLVAGPAAWIAMRGRGAARANGPAGGR